MVRMAPVCIAKRILANQWTAGMILEYVDWHVLNALAENK